MEVTFILEILGRPPEHITEALQTLITRIGSEKGVRIINKHINEPLQVKDSQDLFTSFAELELEVDSLYILFGLIFAYMPAHVEVTKPEKLALSNYDLNDVMNKLAQRLHDYDAITKNAIIQKESVLRKLYEVAPHLFKKTPEPEKPENKSKSKSESKKQKKKKTKT